MTREQAQTRVNAFNEELKNYKEGRMLEELGVKDGQRMEGAEWFATYNRAYKLLQKYYQIGWAILEEARADGHNVKMNMQSYELKLY